MRAWTALAGALRGERDPEVTNVLEQRSRQLEHQKLDQLDTPVLRQLAQGIERYKREGALPAVQPNLTGNDGGWDKAVVALKAARAWWVQQSTDPLQRSEDPAEEQARQQRLQEMAEWLSAEIARANNVAATSWGMAQALRDAQKRAEELRDQTAVKAPEDTLTPFGRPMITLEQTRQRYEKLGIVRPRIPDLPPATQPARE